MGGEDSGEDGSDGGQRERSVGDEVHRVRCTVEREAFVAADVAAEAR